MLQGHTETGPALGTISNAHACVHVAGLWRNPRQEVRRLLDSRHAGAYRVYNLCCEPAFGYPASDFGGAVATFPVADHQVEARFGV